MKRFIIFFFMFLLRGYENFSQSNISTPYCQGTYATGQCNQTGPSNSPTNGINDFINSFNTSGANINIVNNNSGCNQLNNNYIYYGCQHFLAVNAGQTITCNMQSGINFAQGFSIWVDWNQDNTFQNPGEQVAATSNAPAPATWTTLTFVIPATTPNGTYRMRVRCAYAIGGTATTPCGQHTHGETEDYNLYVGFIPNTIITATASSPQPTLCAGESISLTVQHSATSPTYTWMGPGSYSSTTGSPVISGATPQKSGNYTVTVFNGSCPATSTVQILVVPFPTITAVPNSAAICQGGNTTGSVSVVGAINNNQYNWQGPGQIFNPQLNSTLIFPPLLPSNTTFSTIIYTVTVRPVAHNCPVVQHFSVSVSNPSTPTLNLPASLCNTGFPVQITAFPGPGSWSGNPAVSPSGFFSPTLAAIGVNTVTYTTAGLCPVSNTGTILVSRFHTAALSSTLGLICVKDPVINLMNIVMDTTTGSWSSQNAPLNGDLFNPAGLPTGNYHLKYHSPSAPDPLVCPDSITMQVSVFNPPQPIIPAILPRCNNSATFNLSATPAGGVWSGNSGISPSGIQTPSNNLIGFNTVSYTAGQGTCVATSSRTFEVSQFRTAELTGSIAPMCVSGTPFNLMSIVQNNSGDWSGSNVNSNNVFSPAGLATGTYALTYSTQSTPNATLCPDFRSITVSVLNPPVPNIINTGPFCNRSAPVQLSVTPNTGSWTATSFLTVNGVFSPSLSAPGNNIVEYVIGTNTCNARSTKTIVTEAFLSAEILYEVPDMCEGGSPVNLSPFTLNPSGNWSGPGLLGNSFYPGMTGAGEYTLTYNIQSVPTGLCKDQSILSVRVFSLAPPVITAPDVLCTNSLPEKLLASPTGGLFGGNKLGLVTLDGLFNPAHAQTGQNVISYSISVGPCLAYAETTVNVQEFASAEMLKQPEAAYCRNATPFNLNSLARNPGGDWSGTGVTGSMFYPAQATAGKNTIVYTTFSSPNAAICGDSKTVTLVVKEIPQVTASSNIIKGCAPLEVNFSSPESTGGNGYWTFDDGSGTLPGASASHVYTQPGTYRVVYNFSDNEAAGCSTQVVLKDLITVHDVPHAAFSAPDELMISDPVVQLENLSSPLGDNTYWWQVEGLNEYTEVNPLVHFPAAGNYRVKLRASNMYGCRDEVSRMIVVKNEFSVFIPNSFTPNFDGINDLFNPVFSPYGLNTNTYQMEIFDRWGHPVFSSRDHRQGWDGTLNNRGDQVMKEDSYNYRIRYKDLEGNAYTKMGAVVLLH